SSTPPLLHSPTPPLPHSSTPPLPHSPTPPLSTSPLIPNDEIYANLSAIIAKLNFRLHCGDRTNRYESIIK
ncbi:hypothetical protein, partial [Tolypothrix sp. VBCCA 56010]|uniref:hypothetical protein n=1 Tax=Tolypothrix sp. VBCCA 56010 TaxID=3137731 RepID=UPI003D7DFBC4